MTAEREREVISRVISGETQLFEELVTDNQTKVYNLALKITKNPQDAMDISQDAFLKAYSSLRSFRGDSRFSVWLYRLTYNLCLDYMRKQKRTNVISLNGDAGEDDDGAELEIPDLRSMPEAEYEKKELREELNRCFERLPESQRRILILREISGMSYSEIAETMKISEGTVKSRISRARQKLCALMTESGTIPGFLRHNNREEAERK